MSFRLVEISPSVFPAFKTASLDDGKFGRHRLDAISRQHDRPDRYGARACRAADLRPLVAEPLKGRGLARKSLSVHSLRSSVACVTEVTVVWVKPFTRARSVDNPRKRHKRHTDILGASIRRRPT